MGCIVLNVTGMQMDVSFWKASTKILLKTSAEGVGKEFMITDVIPLLNSVLFSRC